MECSRRLVIHCFSTLGSQIGLNDRTVSLVTSYIEKMGTHPKTLKEGLNLAFGYRLLADAPKKSYQTEEVNQYYRKAARLYMAIGGKSLVIKFQMAYCYFDTT